jgi:hypothetical protein
MHCDVAAQHLKPHRRGHMNEYFSFHLAALIIGRVEQFMSHLEQEIKRSSSAGISRTKTRQASVSLMFGLIGCCLGMEPDDVQNYTKRCWFGRRKQRFVHPSSWCWEEAQHHESLHAFQLA